jgi:hypothetical protein
MEFSVYPVPEFSAGIKQSSYFSQPAKLFLFGDSHTAIGHINNATGALVL